MSVSRTEKLRGKVALSPGEGLLVSHEADVRWLTGFSGSNGAVLITGSEVHIFTDGRYRAQIANETTDGVIHVDSGGAVQSAAAYAASLGLRELQFQGGNLSYETVQTLAIDFPDLPCRSSAVLIDRLRSTKEAIEIDCIRRALRITERVFKDCQSAIVDGMSELDLAAEIDYKQRLLGAEKNSFDTIVAFGSRSALPHARPGRKKLSRGEPILLDFGCVIDGYASDMTRMIHFGEPAADFLEAYEAVNKALTVASENAKAGLTGRELDESARVVLREANLESYFSHSLGHGVGLEIHEWPSVSARNLDRLPSGCVITIEPGVYFDGRFGIRIENMVYLNEGNCTTLNDLATNLVVL